MIKIKKLIINLLNPISKILNRLFLKKYYLSNKKLSEIDKSKKILVFAPHMDDETIGLGGTIKRHSLEKCIIHCVFTTDGSKSVSDLSEVELSNIRKNEVENVAQILGIDHLDFMDLPEGEVSSSDENIEQIKRYIQELNPDIVYMPSFIDAHPDHIATAHLIADAIQQIKIAAFKLRLYEINCAIPPKYINFIYDISDVMSDKLDAIQEFTSQAIHFEGFTALSEHKVNLLKDRKQVRNVETFIQLNPDELIKHRNLILELKQDYYHQFKQINREETLIWAIFKSKKIKESLYEDSFSFIKRK